MHIKKLDEITSANSFQEANKKAALIIKQYQELGIESIEDENIKK